MALAVGPRYGAMLMLALVAMLFTFTSAVSADVPGHEDPEFAEALDAWLRGNDLAPLQQMSDLARGGNTAAQILLALIDKTAALPGPELSGLSRADRIALLRAEGGISGQNWMHAAAAANNAIAQTWIALWQMDGGTDLAQRFAQHKETRATREALLAVVSRTEAGFTEQVRAQDWYPASLLHLTEDRVITPADLRDLPANHPLQARVGRTLSEAQLRDWLATDPLAAPLRSACDSACPATRTACALALYDAIGGYSGLLVMGSPVASLIADDDFAQSARGIESVARRIMLRHSARTRMTLLRDLAEQDSCAANWLEAEFKRYSPSKRSAPVQPD